MHHLFSRHGFSFMSASRRPTVALDRVSCVVRRTNAPASNSSVQCARPAGGAEQATATRAGFIAGAELPRCTGPGRFDERARQAVFDEMLLGPIHRRGADPDVCRNPFVGDLGVGGEENLCPFDLARGPGAAAGQRRQVVPFFERQRHAIAYVHGYLGSHGRSRVQSSAPRFTAKQGQYLAFIHTYALLYREPPAEADFQRFFQVTPPRSTA